MTGAKAPGAAPNPTADTPAPAEAPVAPAAPAGPAEPAEPAQPPPWADTDRPRGLDAPFAPGGEDAASPERSADERRLARLLVLTVVLLVGVPTLLTLVAFVGQLLALRGG